MLTRPESRVADILIRHGFPITHNKVLSGTKYRPDFIIIGRTAVVLEVDEHCHAKYDQDQERLREQRITARLNDSGHDVYILRFDPYKARLSRLMVDIVPLVRSLLNDTPATAILERLNATIDHHVIRVY